MSPAISRRAAEQLLRAIRRDGSMYLMASQREWIGAELERALRRKSVLKPLKKKSGAKRQQTSAIRGEVWARSCGKCEACGDALADGELDHFFGRGKAPQSVRNCWRLCSGCHRAKTLNRPDSAYWLRRFNAHCLAHGYAGEVRLALNRLAFVEARSSLPAAPGASNQF